jgi:hypothetical protein
MARSSARPGLSPSAENSFSRGMVLRAKEGPDAVRRRDPQPWRYELHDRPQSITGFDLARVV